MTPRHGAHRTSLGHQERLSTGAARRDPAAVRRRPARRAAAAGVSPAASVARSGAPSACNANRACRWPCTAAMCAAVLPRWSRALRATPAIARSRSRRAASACEASAGATASRAGCEAWCEGSLAELAGSGRAAGDGRRECASAGCEEAHGRCEGPITRRCDACSRVAAAVGCGVTRPLDSAVPSTTDCPPLPRPSPALPRHISDRISVNRSESPGGRGGPTRRTAAA
eukprot:scaffold5904_cov134-Isochrysis_galbana.AAC.3